MTQQQLDHAYHRSRADAQIHGAIYFTATMAVLALTIGDRFQPFQPDARLLEPVRLVWMEKDQSWVSQKMLVTAGNYPPEQNVGQLVTREILPTGISVILVVGSLAVAGFLYGCARRQVNLMNAVYDNNPDQPYHRAWSDVRMTFWALYVVLAFILLFFMT